MKKVETIKTFPKGSVSINIEISQDNDGFSLITCNGIDEDGDSWDVGYAKCFALPLTEAKIDKVSKHSEIIESSDAKTTLLSFEKSKKAKLFGKDILYLDVLFISQIFRRNGIGKMIMSEIIEFAKTEGLQGVVLKAHPFVTWQYGIIKQQSNKQIREDRAILHEFYSKLGFMNTTKTSDIMFLILS